MFKHLFLIYLSYHFCWFYKCRNVSCTLIICISNLLPNLHSSFGWTERIWRIYVKNILIFKESIYVMIFFPFNHKDMLRNYRFISGFWLIFCIQITLNKTHTHHWRQGQKSRSNSEHFSQSIYVLCYIERLWFPLSNPTNAAFCTVVITSMANTSNWPILTWLQVGSFWMSHEHEPFHSGKHAKNL